MKYANLALVHSTEKKSFDVIRSVKISKVQRSTLYKIFTKIRNAITTQYTVQHYKDTEKLAFVKDLIDTHKENIDTLIKTMSDGEDSHLLSPRSIRKSFHWPIFENDN